MKIKIMTWNINSIRLRLELLKKITEIHAPDIIGLQEIKVIDEKFPYQEIRDLGYSYICVSGEKSYNGVAILTKKPFYQHFTLKLYNNDKRHIAIKIFDIEIHNFYFPAGGEVPDANVNLKFKHKLEYLNLATSWFKENRSKNEKIILMGDFNIAPYENDVWSSKALANVVSHTMIERKSLLEMQKSLDFIDSSYQFISNNRKIYTWWSYRNKDWQKSNRGRRLDHIWTSNNFKNNISSVETLIEARSWPSPSDHVPYFITIKI